MDKKPIAAGKSSFELVDSGAVFAELDLDRETVLLDVASGAGNYAVPAAVALAGKGKVFAVDLWREGIEELKRRAAGEGLANLTAMVSDASKHIPLEDASVDVCLIATALHDLAREGDVAEGALREIARVLKRQGKLVVLEFKKEEGTHGPPMHIRLSPRELDDLVTPFGFDKQRTRPAGDHAYLAVYRRR